MKPRLARPGLVCRHRLSLRLCGKRTSGLAEVDDAIKADPPPLRC